MSDRVDLCECEGVVDTPCGPGVVVDGVVWTRFGAGWFVGFDGRPLDHQRRLDEVRARAKPGEVVAAAPFVLAPRSLTGTLFGKKVA